MDGIYGCGCRRYIDFLVLLIPTPLVCALFCSIPIYLYCVYALVGGAISIRDQYICAVHESVPTNLTLSSIGPLTVQ